MHDDIRILSAYYGEQCIRIDGNGGSDTPAADIDFVKISGTVMKNGRILFFMPKGVHPPRT